MNSGPVVSESFSRDDRLRKRREFEECYASGVRVSGRHVQVFLLAGGPAERPRLGISVPRRVGQRRRAQSGPPAPARDLPALARASSGRRRRRWSSTRVRRRPRRSFRELSEDYARGACRGARRRSAAAAAGERAGARGRRAARVLQALPLAAPAPRLPLRADLLGLRARGDRAARPRAAAAGSPCSGSAAATRSTAAASTRCREEAKSHGKTPPPRGRRSRSASCSLWEWLVPKPPPPRRLRAPTPARRRAAAPSRPPAPRRRLRRRPDRRRRPRRLRARERRPSDGRDALRTTSSRATFSNRGAVLTSFVLTQVLRRAEAAARARARAAAGASAAARRSTSARTPRRRKRVANALFVVEQDSDRGRALPLRRRVDRRDQGDPRSATGTSSTSRSPSSGPAYGVLVGPGLRNPTEAERASRYVMPASAVAASADGLKLVRPEKADGRGRWPLPPRGLRRHRGQLLPGAS